MWIGLISIFPQLVEGIASVGILGRALVQGRLQLEVFNPRDQAADRRSTVDDRPYGGGPGMVMMAEPLLACIAAARDRAPSSPQVIYLSPQGRRLDQGRVQNLARLDSLVLVAGRYEGVDERVLLQAVDAEISIGDYVLSGGELPAMVLVEALCRLLPGALGNEASAVRESHLDGLLDCPQYTRPGSVAGMTVPEVLLSGDHGAVAQWRRSQALLRTWRRRPDLLSRRALDDDDMSLLRRALETAAASEGNNAEWR